MRHQGRRTFAVAFCSTLLLVGLLFGWGRVDAASRHVGFHDGRTWYVRELRPLLSRHKALCKITDLWYNRFIEIVCPEALED